MLTTMTKLLWWIAGISGVAIVLLLIVMVTGELGEPTGPEWVYLFFFPFGFSVGYVIALRWPLVGGCVSLACMAISQVVTGRVFDLGAYTIWGLMCVPAVLFLIVGLRKRARPTLLGAATSTRGP